MSPPSGRPRLQSWIPPAFAWLVTPDIFCIEVPADDPDVVEFVSLGERECVVLPNKGAARAAGIIMGSESFAGQLVDAAWDVTKLKPRGQRANSRTKVVAYCHGVFLLPGEKRLCVLVGREKPISSNYWISQELKIRADDLLEAHRSSVAAFEKSIECEAQKNEEIYGRNVDMKKFKWFADATLSAKAASLRPVVTAESLLSFLPRAVLLARNFSRDIGKRTRLAIAAVAGSNVTPSRDGIYTGIVMGPDERKAHVVVFWTPHVGLSPYPEVRWAVQRRLPAALQSPRIRKPGRPKFDTGVEWVENAVQLDGFDAALDDLRLDDTDFRKKVDEVRQEIKNDGFEAIAWFQSYHVWAEETWGIYMDAQKMDDLAWSFVEDFKCHGVQGSQTLAAFLAVGLVYAHELFHAKVEAALSWLELTGLQPRYLRYKRRVYDSLRGTPDWLEESLANWSAWEWFRDEATQSVIKRLAPCVQGLERIVESSLDLAPSGYREWRVGGQRAAWRKLATQLASGNSKLASPWIGLPIESALIGASPYDLQLMDIPLRFIGHGAIAGRLQDHPATFNVPSRRELEKALKHFKHEVDSSGGKGGHQKWTGPDQRAFILPTRDPVSPKVFNSFLHHVRIDKAKYVREVRPNL